MLRYAKVIVFSLLLLAIAPSLAQSQEYRSPSHIVYVKDNVELYLADVATGTSTPVTGLAGSFYTYWQISPNGRYVIRYNSCEFCTTSLRVFDIDQNAYLGNLPVIEATSPERVGVYTWLPDSSGMSYARNRDFGIGQLWRLDFTTGRQVLLYEPEPVEEAYSGPSIGTQWWSPSGERLVFEEGYSFQGDVYSTLMLTDLRRSEPIRLYQRESAHFNPLVWSPDSRWFVVRLRDVYNPDITEPETDPGDLYLYDAVDGTQYPITRTPDVEESNVRWSEDGQYIQYEREGRAYQSPLSDVLNVALTGQPIRVQPLANPDAPQIEGATFQRTSPDGAYIAFMRHNEGEDYTLWIVDANLTHYQKIAEDAWFLGWRYESWLARNG